VWLPSFRVHLLVTADLYRRALGRAPLTSRGLWVECLCDRAFLLDRYDRIRLPHTLEHGDRTLKNFGVHACDESATILFDWEFMSRAPVGVWLLPEARERFVASYLGHGGVPFEMSELAKLDTLCSAAGQLAWDFAAGYEVVEGRKTAAQVAQQYEPRTEELARLLASPAS
jgi:hypothetical protein